MSISKADGAPVEQCDLRALHVRQQPTTIPPRSRTQCVGTQAPRAVWYLGRRCEYADEGGRTVVCSVFTAPREYEGYEYREYRLMRPNAAPHATRHCCEYLHTAVNTSRTHTVTWQHMALRRISFVFVLEFLSVSRTTRQGPRPSSSPGVAGFFLSASNSLMARATIALLLASACQVSCLVLQTAGARPRAVVASRCRPAMSMEEGDRRVGERGER